MATGKALNGKPYAGNPHVWFGEGEVTPAATHGSGAFPSWLSHVAAVCCMMVSSVASAGGISSMTCGAFLDSHPFPQPQAVGSGDSVDIVFAGDWFPSGECRLFVDDGLVASSSGAVQTYALAGTDGSLRSHRLTIQAGDEEISRFVTFVPSADFRSSVHGISLRDSFLDSRPAGTVRRIDPNVKFPVVWSGLWNEGASGATVSVHSGTNATGTPISTLVDSAGAKEGVYWISCKRDGLPIGRYALTHFDGIETLVALVKVMPDRFCISFR